MLNPQDQILTELSTFLNQDLPYQALAERAAADGRDRLAHLLRAVHTSETIRRRLVLNGVIHHQDDARGLFVCPHCGLLMMPEPPQACPVDETPGADFINVA